MSESTIAPPPAAPAPAPPRPGLHGRDRLPLPEPGTRFAVGGLVLGIAFYVVFGGGFLLALAAGSGASGAGALADLFGLGEDGSLIITGLIALGGGLFVLTAWSVWRDRAELAREEVDVEWVHRHGREWMALVLAPPAERDALRLRGSRTYGGGVRVETLMDDRVRRALEQSANRYARFSPEEMRAIAETRTARYGNVARFASALLLLLAVLGTFAGVKTALPGLIDAVSAAGGSVGATADITGPLRAVSDAFGGNALALVGAIAAGLMAQGLAMGRRNLLERLELVSTEFVYGSAVESAADPLTAAVRELSDTAASVRDAGQAMAGLESGISALAASFDSAFGTLNQRLVEVAEQQDAALHQRTSGELRQLQLRVADLAGAVAAGQDLYRGIIDSVEERGVETRAMVARLDQLLGRMDGTLQDIGRAHAAAAETSGNAEAALERLRAGTDHALARIEAVSHTLNQAGPAFDQVERTLAVLTERVASVDERAAQRWTEAARQVHGRMEELVERAASRGGGLPAPAEGRLPAEGGGRAAPEGDAELARLLRRVAQAVESPPRPPLWKTIGLQAAGVVAGVGAFYLLMLLAEAAGRLVGGA